MKTSRAISAFSLLLALTACTSPYSQKANTSLPALPAGAHPLFEGGSFAGWKIASPNPYWSFSPDGILTAENDAALHGYDLYTEKSYKDVEFEIEFRYTGNADSGIYLRKPLIQVQIGVSSSLHAEKTASLFQEGKGGGYIANATNTDQLLKPNDWNTLHFIAQGDTLKVWLNGTHVACPCHHAWSCAESVPVARSVFNSSSV